MNIKKYFIESHNKEENSKIANKLNIVLVIFFLIFTLILFFLTGDYNLDWEPLLKYRYKFIYGFLITMLISIFSLFLSLFLGVFFAIGQRSRFLPFRYFSKIYIEIIRGTPLLVQILIFFYVVADSLHIENRYLAGIIILSLFAGAYVTEIVRAGIESVEKSQIEAAKSLGFTSIQKYRYVILPQVIRRIMPSLAGQFASLIKDSSLLSIIAVRELTMNAQEINSYTYATLESYIPLAIAYLILTLPISMWSKSMERKFYYES